MKKGWFIHHNKATNIPPDKWLKYFKSLNKNTSIDMFINDELSRPIKRNVMIYK